MLFYFLLKNAEILSFLVESTLQQARGPKRDPYCIEPLAGGAASIGKWWEVVGDEKVASQMIMIKDLCGLALS